VSFDEFGAARLPGLLRYAVMLTGERELAHDIVQEVLVRAHGRWRRIAATDRPDLYIKRMVTNEFLTWRRLRRLVTVPIQVEVAQVSPSGADPMTCGSDWPSCHGSSGRYSCCVTTRV